MLRRTVLTSICGISFAVAAACWAQNGGSIEQRGSLADRLSALRRQATAESQPSRVQRPAAPQAAPVERSRKPRLLEQLDPLNLFPLGGRKDEPTPSENPRTRRNTATGPRTAPSSLPRQGLPTPPPRPVRAELGSTEVRSSPINRRAEIASQTPGTTLITDLNPKEVRVKTSQLPTLATDGTIASDTASAPAEVNNASVSVAMPNLAEEPQVADEHVLDNATQAANPLASGVRSSPLAVEAQSPAAMPEDEPKPAQAIPVASAVIADAASEAASAEAVTPIIESPTPAEASSRYSSGSTPYATAQDASIGALDLNSAPAEESDELGDSQPAPSKSPSDEATPEEASSQEEGRYQSEELSPTPTAKSVFADEVRVQASRSSNVLMQEEQLISTVSPALETEIRGPEQIIIGRPAMFQVNITNRGRHNARKIVGRVRVPHWAEINSAEATDGVGQRVTDDDDLELLEWRIAELPPGRDAALRLEVIPRSSHSLDLDVTVAVEPTSALTQIRVLEPKLQLAVDGPSDILFGEKQTFRMTVTNPGTGPAEDVVLKVHKPGNNLEEKFEELIGNLAAGESRTVEIPFDPQQAGKLAMQAHVSAIGDLSDEVSKQFFVRRAALEVDARGPRSTYSGTVVTSYVKVRNGGDANAEDVQVAAEIPAGAEILGASEGHQVDASGQKVHWKLGTLPPNVDTYLELRYTVSKSGRNDLAVDVQSRDSGVAAAAQVQTHVIALADLKLEVTDPRGPIATGEDAVYEVRILNRGNNAAEEVNVVVLFSDGIDPIEVEGGHHLIENGRVAFRTIETLPAGRDVVFKIRANAHRGGTHRFRAEVLCRELETKLSAEETTRFYDSAKSETSAPERTARRFEPVRQR